MQNECSAKLSKVIFRNRKCCIKIKN
jgi:hypothetical protein